MRALCEYFGAKLHNFGPNSISQAAVFVAVSEGYLGIEAHWDLWIHLFRDELFIENVQGQPKRSDAPLAPNPEEFVHPQQDDDEQCRVDPRVVLPAQLRQPAPGVHQQGAPGEAGEVGLGGISPTASG